MENVNPSPLKDEELDCEVTVEEGSWMTCDMNPESEPEDSKDPSA